MAGNQIAIAHLKNGVLDWTHTFTPALLNEARFGMNYISFVNNNYTFASSVGTLAAGLGIAGGPRARRDPSRPETFERDDQSARRAGGHRLRPGPA